MAEHIYHVGNLDCAHCAQEVETAVTRLDGVNAVRVDFTTGKMVLDGTVEFNLLQERIEAIGKTVATEAPAEKPSYAGITGFIYYLNSRFETRLALAGGALTLLTVVLSLLFTLPETLIAALYTIAMVIAAYPIAKNGINTLRINHEFNINLLMSIAAVGAIVIGEYLEATTVIFLFAIGESLEGYTTDRARDSLRSLMSLKPTEALRTRNGIEETVHINDLKINDVIIVKPGEQIPMDGEVIAGISGVNQAPITGESVPINKIIGDQAFAGSINGEGTLEIRVTHLAADNTLSRIITMVEEAQSVRAPSQRIIDRFAHYYTPGIVMVALLVAIIPPMFFDAPFFNTTEGTGWLYRALTILVIGCPCALVISTPVTVISAITAAARKGILIKGGIHLESLGHIKAIAFDKTGTLTQGKPLVTTLHAASCQTGDDNCPACEDVLAMAAAVERRSTHPLAQAIVNASERLEQRYATASNVEVLAGQGVRGYIDDNLVTVGSHSYFDAHYPHEFCNLVNEAEQMGQTTMLVHDGTRVSGFIAVSDQPREDSKAVINSLHQLGVATIMLTGDNITVANAIGKAINVTNIHANLLPEDKVATLNQLKADYTYVAMVGDGVNDTPALASATVGIAMGGAGSAQALETADIALMADDIKQLPFAIRLSRFAQSIIWQNIGITFVIKLIFLILAVFGATTMWLAVFADVGMSLIVTMNGMRPLKLDNQK